MQAGFLGEGRSSRVRRGMWRAARSEPTAGSGSAARHSAPPRCRACRWHAGSRAYRSTAAQAARMLPAVFKRAMLALLERVAADPLLQWRWPPLRQGIGRRWSLKVLERFSAHWHWLPMALSRPLLASLGSRASFEPTCHLPPTIATVSTDPSLQRLRSVLTVGLTATCRRPQRAHRRHGHPSQP